MNITSTLYRLQREHERRNENGKASHSLFADTYGLPFPLLSDPNNQVVREYGATSLLMLGGATRAVFLVGRHGLILYRYVEPTVLTHRKAGELLGIVSDLSENGLI